MAIRFEQTGWVFSGVLHLGVAVAALVGLPRLARDMPAPPPPINIEFVRIAEETRVVAPKAPEVQQAQVAEKPQPNYAAAEAVEPVADDAAPLLEKAKPVKVAPTPKPKPRPQVSENRKLANRVAPRAKPKPPSRLKIKRIAALIDRSIKEEQEQIQKVEEPKKEAVKAPEPDKKPLFSPGLRGQIATASIVDALGQKVAENWSIPGGAKGIQGMQVTIRIWLRPDGYLSRTPEFLDAGNLNDPDRAFFRVFAESAKRAVLLSEPFSEVAKNLGADQKYIDFNFNPSSFLGG